MEQEQPRRRRRPKLPRRFKPLASPESGPDLPRVQACACDMRSLLADCRAQLDCLSGQCRLVLRCGAADQLPS
jgi:hypothetical protein